MLGFRSSPGHVPATHASRASVHAVRATAVLGCLAGSAVAETTEHPAEKVRVTYEATGECPTADTFLAEVRSRIGTAWEAPPNELARTIDVRVTGGADHSVARIDFVDENRQPITRVVTAKSCDEVVTGIALVTALAIESRIAEAVGQSEPAAPAPPSAKARASEEPKVAATPRPPPPAPRPAPPSHRAAGARPHLDVGGGLLGGAGSLPKLALGPRGFVGFGWSRGPDFRLGADFLSNASVDTNVNGRDYLSSFRLLLGRASACPLGFGSAVRLLPCGGVEIGELKGAGIDRQVAGIDVKGSEKSLLWLAPFVSVRGDVSSDVFFVELELSLAFAAARTGTAFNFVTRIGNASSSPDTVYTVWPVSPGAAFTVGLRL